jgi:hypothetical protein
MSNFFGELSESHSEVLVVAQDARAVVYIQTFAARSTRYHPRRPQVLGTRVAGSLHAPCASIFTTNHHANVASKLQLA